MPGLTADPSRSRKDQCRWGRSPAVLEQRPHVWLSASLLLCCPKCRLLLHRVERRVRGEVPAALRRSWGGEGLSRPNAQLANYSTMNPGVRRHRAPLQPEVDDPDT